jgi:glucosyl-dolichyl phosphate glucuronosyltransferase
MAPRQPRLSIVICTHNRSRDLDSALASLAKQTLDAGQFEIIVVDNRSADDTREVTEARQSSQPIRYMYEAELGLCQARNTGWKAAAGEFVAYLDDDAVAEPLWAAEILGAFDAGTPRLGCVGGRIEPIYHAPRPAWLSDQVALSLTIVDWSPTPHVIEDLRQEWLAGANIAFPRQVLEEVGGFHPALDRSGRQMLSSGDVYLQRLIMEAGYQCLYHPAAAVRHQVPASRLEKRWFINRFYWQGESDAVMEVLHDRLDRSARRRSAMRKATAFLKSPGQLVALLLPTSDPERFARKCWAWIALGHTVGLLRAR